MVRQRAACSGSLHPAIFRRGCGAMTAMAVVLTFWCTHLWAEDTPKSTLARAVPHDVLVFVSTRHNPERAFIDDYWDGIVQEACRRGLDGDVMSLVGSLLGESGTAEALRLKARALELMGNVDWRAFGTREIVVAERLNPPMRLNTRNAVFAPPDLVVIVQADRAAIDGNFQGLRALLQALTEEVNKAADAQILTMERSTIHTADVAAVNLLAALPGAPPLQLAVAHSGDIVVISFGQTLRDEVLGLLNGVATKAALADDPRFVAAFAGLPPARDSLEFFNAPQLVQFLEPFIKVASTMAAAPRDVYLNTAMDAAASEAHSKALDAYRHGDYAGALKFTQQAHASASGNSIILYNLACFSALTGESEAALARLQEAVQAGFCAPGKIAEDTDLNSLRDHPRYAKILEGAARRAREGLAEDRVINSSKSGEAYKLNLQAMQMAEQGDYEQALRLVEQAAEVAPHDSRVLYNQACFHARLGHRDQALRFLGQAVDGGFLCPGHIAADSDLDGIREDPRYAVVLDRARIRSVALGASRSDQKVELIRHFGSRLLDAVGTIDYAATVQSTSGFDTVRETRTVLVGDAAQRSIYSVFGGQQHQQSFQDVQRYLPRETLSFAVSGGFDPTAAYDYLEDTIRDSGETGTELLGHWQEVQEEFGVNIRRDVVSWIAGTAITMTLEDNRGWVSLIKVTDEQRARDQVNRLLDTAATKVQELASRIPPLAMLTSRRSPVTRDGLEGFESLHVTFAPATPIVWGVADGHLILGSSADAVALCRETAAGRHPNVLENPRVQAEALLPDGPVASVSFSDRRQLGQDLAMATGVVSMVLGPMAMSIPEERPRSIMTRLTGLLAKLPPVLGQIDFYKSTASVTTFDGRAWHTRRIIHYVDPAERGAGGEAGGQ